MRDVQYQMGETYAKMNSASPYIPAPNMLIVMVTAKAIVIQAAGLIVEFQKLMRTTPALSSAGRRIVQLYLTD